MVNKESHVIIINKQTKLGAKGFVQGKICGIVDAIVSITDGVELEDIYQRPLVEGETYVTLYIECTKKAFELVKQQVKKQYPDVCLFGQHYFD